MIGALPLPELSTYIDQVRAASWEGIVTRASIRRSWQKPVLRLHYQAGFPWTTGICGNPREDRATYLSFLKQIQIPRKEIQYPFATSILVLKCGNDETFRTSRNCIFWTFTYFVRTLPSRFSIRSREGNIFTVNISISCPPLLDHVPANMTSNTQRATRRSVKFSILFAFSWAMVGRWCVVQGWSNSSTNQTGISLHYSPFEQVYPRYLAA